MDVYLNEYKSIFDSYGILNIFLVTPQTSDSAIKPIDEVSEGFIYTVSSASVTGSNNGVSNDMESYFDRLNAMNLKNPRLIGFGIKDHATFKKASNYAAGAIIGSAFITGFDGERGSWKRYNRHFVQEVKQEPEEVITT